MTVTNCLSLTLWFKLIQQRLCRKCSNFNTKLSSLTRQADDTVAEFVMTVESRQLVECRRNNWNAAQSRQKLCLHIDATRLVALSSVGAVKQFTE